MRVRDLEEQMRRLEGFDVRLLNEDGRDMRGDATGLSPYAYERYGGDNTRVSDWVGSRIRSKYGYDAEVLDGNTGKPVHGNTLLGSVRETYR